MELRHLHYFIAVAEELNFSRAAARLHIAQPPLSKQIHDLEDDLGVQLFDRTQRPLQLTLAGRVFLDEARSAIASVDRAVNMAQRASRGEIGRLVIGFTSSMANSFLPDILRVYLERFPLVELVWRELATSIQMQALRDRHLDVGFFHLPSWMQEEVDLAWMTICHESLIVALPETHPLASQPQVSLKALAQEVFILPSRQFSPVLSEQLEHLCQQSGISPVVIQEGTLMLTILGLVAGGVGVALLPANVQNLQRKGVLYKNIAEPTPTVPMAAVWRQDDASATLREFLGVTKAIAQTHSKAS
ncbi:LysR substrate-binding domain-containing protein [Coleofasciculus sp. FACHB-SPT9]|uniref:LysR substrate-binding domain-containing protein n=1 Tax=Cyanophyceae TaxID=3028117 RepID=UPI0016888EF7|nr:LysR substrate-binding domain-containing protein [Coleofasciculus sp. FACHB-SPT9]MBD1890844.1 LysR family transcriptional regulator [Coleofasciculus sp. FACHB-SPT9]